MTLTRLSDLRQTVKEGGEFIKQARQATDYERSIRIVAQWTRQVIMRNERVYSPLGCPRS